MNWDNLQNNQCPSCEGELLKHPDKDLMKCVGCDFSIGLAKYRTILDGMDEQRNVEGSNQKALSDL